MPDPFFIVGNSRSGTTLISRILKNNSSIHVLNETHFFEEFTSQIQCFEALNNDQLCRLVNSMITIQRKDYYRKSEYDEYPHETGKIIAEYAQSERKGFNVLNKIFFAYEAKRQGKKRAGDQTPRHVFYVAEIFSMYPDAKVIHMLRDPRAVLYSQRKKWASGFRRKQPIFEVLRTLLNYHPVTMSLLWCKAVRAGLDAEKLNGVQRVKTLVFENFVKDPDFYIKKVCEFLDTSFNPGMLDVSVELSAARSQEGQKGISKAVAQQWQKDLSCTEIFLCEKIAGRLMEEIGYPLSRKSPNLIHLGFFTVCFPFHICIALLMNISRMGNPIKYISKRLFQSK